KASNEQTCSLDHGRLSDRQQIPCRFHEKLRNEIKVIHKRKKPSWGNASTDTWGDSPFAVAKLFMQPAGYDDKSSFDEIDFNGLAAFIYNCGKYTPTLETLFDEPAGYDDKSSFDEIDFNGLAAFIYNCGKYTPTLETLSDE
ncbi:hypothetical protein MAR_003974, partial [Mya arenaria]